MNRLLIGVGPRQVVVNQSGKWFMKSDSGAWRVVLALKTGRDAVINGPNECHAGIALAEGIWYGNRRARNNTMNHRYPPAAALLCIALAIPLHATPENDLFADSIQLEGTNLTYVGNLSMATFEANEPDPGATNTLWVSWVAPSTGRARFTTVSLPRFHAAVYTGGTLDLLEPVPFVDMDNRRFDFLAIAGTTYHFQMAGDADECTLSIEHNAYGAPPNDHFADAHHLAGYFAILGVNPPWFPVGGATAEIGEPAHLDGVPFKSLWWKWTSPQHGTAYFEGYRSLTGEIVFAVYEGDAIEALRLIARGTNEVHFPMNGGDQVHIAAMVPPEAMGDVRINGGLSDISNESRIVPGNLLREPSWEGTALENTQYWQKDAPVGGIVNGLGGADGTTWPILSPGSSIWQEIETVPGQNHAIRFALRSGKDLGTGIGNARVRVLWDEQEIGIAEVDAGEVDFWHWPQLTAVATETISRVTFENLGRQVELDAFSVVSLTAPPEIIHQPSSASVIDGGTVAFTVGVNGSSPLTYEWYFNDSILAGQTNGILLLEAVGVEQAGSYHAVVSNPFGTVTSAAAALEVEVHDAPVIVWQPYGDTVGVGGYHNFSVSAAGAFPLSYQWFKNGDALDGETNRNLFFNPVEFSNAGTYAVRVDSSAGVVWSLDARLVVTDAVEGGGLIHFRNQFNDVGVSNAPAPVFDVDGATVLSGPAFVAQLYGGPSLELLRPAGEPSPFGTGDEGGFWEPRMVTLPTVAPGADAVVQVRVWEAAKGSSYEEARALGGKFGTSGIFSVTAGRDDIPPAELEDLESFSLRAGLPGFTVGRIDLLERQPGGMVVWSHRGEPGFRYVIERSVHGFEWQPHLVITNVTSTVPFTDDASSGSAVTFYRSRILD